jgi:hypothetical protein
MEQRSSPEKDALSQESSVQDSRGIVRRQSRYTQGLNREADRILTSVSSFCNGDANAALSDLLIAHESIEVFLDEIESAHAVELIRQRDNAERDFARGHAIPWEQIKRENGL